MKGWIKSVRASKSLIFLGVTDGCQDSQITIKEGCEVKGELKVGASFFCEGQDSVTPKGLPEFLADKITIIGKSDDHYPIQPKHHTHDFLRTIPELRGRTKTFQAVWKARHHLSQSIHEYLSSKGFFQYWTPIITQADCEGAGETFQVKSDWLDEKLTVSGQLHGEVGMMSLGKIYTFGPCFRAEKSSTKKHLSEFWMLEPELVCDYLDELVDLSEDMLKFVLSKSLEKMSGSPLDLSHIQDIVSKDWIRIKYSDVCDLFGLEYGQDVGSELEKKLVERFESPVFITHWPKDLKPFYMKKDSDVAYCFDLIFPEVGELIGGSMREEDHDILKSEMEASGLDMEKMDWYLKTRRWGSVPHGGFGLGFDRLVTYFCGLPKIHDSIPFPISF